MATVTSDAPIDAYLATLPVSQRDALQKLRTQIRLLAPDAVETISYGMPTFKVRGRLLVSFAGWKEHCSLYPLSGSVLEAHAEALKGFDRTKGSVHFTPEKPLPAAFVEALVSARLADLEAGRR